MKESLLEWFAHRFGDFGFVNLLERGEVDPWKPGLLFDY